jgi:hypothetical protein
MSVDQTIDQHKANIAPTAYIWAMENLHHKYDNFFDMLLGETDDRCIIPSYLAVQLSKRDTEEGESDLAFFLARAITYETLYDTYVEETRKVLGHLFPTSDYIQRVFGVYDEIILLSPADRTDTEILETIIGDLPYGDAFI